MGGEAGHRRLITILIFIIRVFVCQEVGNGSSSVASNGNGLNAVGLLTLASHLAGTGGTRKALMTITWRTCLTTRFINGSRASAGASKGGSALAAVWAKILFVERTAANGDGIGSECQTMVIAEKRYVRD